MGIINYYSIISNGCDVMFTEIYEKIYCRNDERWIKNIQLCIQISEKNTVIKNYKNDN